MTTQQAEKLFKRYNPESGVKRAPNGRAKLKPVLDKYAKTLTDLSGIIKIQEFVDIYNEQNPEERTTTEEVYVLLLPTIVKASPRYYGFYQDYLVQNSIFYDKNWIEKLEEEQKNKPRYIPTKEKIMMFGGWGVEEEAPWINMRKALFDIFGYKKTVEPVVDEIRELSFDGARMQEVIDVLANNNLTFDDQDSANAFLQVYLEAHNNHRTWFNNGHTPCEIHQLNAENRTQKVEMKEITKPPGRNEPCICGSGKKYKKCCLNRHNSHSNRLSWSEGKLFYETWWKLLAFVNHQYKITNQNVSGGSTGIRMDKIFYELREKLWKKPELITSLIKSNKRLTNDEIEILKGWRDYHVSGTFTILKHLDEYTIFLGGKEKEPARAFAVKGMSNSIDRILGDNQVYITPAVLLPFKGKIVYDTFLQGNFVMAQGAVEFANQEYEKVADKIISSLG